MCPVKKVKVLSQLYLTLCDPMDDSPPGFSVHGILQARILEWTAIPFSRGSSQPRDRTWVSCIAGRFFICLILILKLTLRNRFSATIQKKPTNFEYLNE